MPRLRSVVTAGLFVAAATIAVAQDKQKFEAKFEENKAFFQEVTTDVSQTIKVQGGSDMALKHKQTFFFKWTPVKKDGDRWQVKQTIEGVKMSVDIAGNPVNYDSSDANPAGASGNPGLADFFKSLVGAEFTVTFGKGMVVEKVDGKDSMLAKLSGVNPQLEAQLKKILSDDALKEMCDPAAGLTAPAEKAVNESWEKKTTLGLGPIGGYDRTFTYTYKGKDPARKELDRVEVTAKLSYKAPTDAGDGLLFRIKSGTLESIDPKPGVLLFDAKTGRVVESEIPVKMKGTLNVTIGSTETSVELFQEQKTTTKTSDTSLMAPKK